MKTKLNRADVRTVVSRPPAAAPGCSPGARRAGFTLVELLVVIGIIAVLVGILMPALIAARKAANTTQCGSNMRQIGMAMRLYLDQNKGKFPLYHPNGGIWRDPGSGAMLLESDGRAYWGIMYVSYLLKNNSEYDRQVANGAGATAGLAWARSLWQCPASAVTDLDPGYSENYVSDHTATLGLNALINGRNTARVRNASEFILCHDAWEHLLEGNSGGDWLMAYSVQQISPTQGVALKKESGNLLQYMGQPYAKVMRQEYYRHKRQSQALWLDGHVSLIPESNGTDIPFHWYTGDANSLVR
jgi:prepilin-type N-terminal cleavage/methylation domain-containing protein/prepilin-type processing-associated H-X9-DG protein